MTHFPLPKLEQAVLAHLDRVSLPPVPPVPPAPKVCANPPKGSSSDAYFESADAHRSLVNTARQVLSSQLEGSAQIWLTAALEAARLQGRCEVQAASRVPTSSSAEYRLRHVCQRLRERFGIEMTTKTLSGLLPQWKQGRVVTHQEHYLIREVHFLNATIYAVYDLQASGAQSLTTVLANHPDAAQE